MDRNESWNDELVLDDGFDLDEHQDEVALDEMAFLPREEGEGFIESMEQRLDAILEEEAQEDDVLFDADSTEAVLLGLELIGDVELED